MLSKIRPPRAARLFRLFPLSLIATALASSSGSTWADATWVLNGSGQWLNAANWSTNPVVPNGQDQNVFFGGATTVAANVTLSGAPFTVGSLNFDSAFGYVIAASASNLTLATSAGNAAITVTNINGNSSNTISAPLTLLSPTVITNNDLPTTLPFQSNALLISGRLAGAPSLSLNGSGQVIFSGNNSGYTGAISINSGTLFASSSAALGSGTSAADGTTINTNGTLAVNIASAVANEYLTLNGGTLQSNASTLTLNKPLAITANSLITASGHNIITLNSLVGSANLTLGTAAFILRANTSANIFTGNLILASNASANLTGSLPNASFTINPGTAFTFALPVGTDPALNSVAPASIIANGGEVGVSADIDFRPALSANSTLSGILFNTANATLAGTNSLDMNSFNNPSTLRIGGTGSIAATMDLRPDLATHTLRLGLPDFNSALTVNATLADHDSAPANLDVNGGTTTLSAANTFTGTTTIANATLVITNANALGSASGTDADSTIINANGTLRLGTGITLNSEKITVNVGGALTANNSTGTYANPITMNGGTLGAGTYTGTLSGNGNFNVTNATLAGASTYTGNLTINGNATLNSTAALSPNGNNVLVSGNLIVTQPFSAPLLVTGGALTLASNISLSNAPITLSGGTLSGANTTSVFANTITMNGGTLGNGTFSGIINGPGNFTVNGATLAGTGLYTGAATISGQTNVTSASAFSAFGTTILNGNGVSITAPVFGAFTIAAGQTFISVPTTGPVTLAGGTLNLSTSINGPFFLAGGLLQQNTGLSSLSTPLTLIGGNAQIVANSALKITGGATGVGNIQLFAPLANGAIDIASTFNNHGSLIISQGAVQLDVQPGPLTNIVVDGGNFGTPTLTVTQNMALANLSLVRGSLSTTATATVNFGSGNLSVDNVSINANLAGTGSIIKIGGGTLDIGSLGTYTGAVIVQSGNLLFDYHSRKGPTAGVTVASHDATIGGGLTQGSQWTFAENVSLQNATGINFGGALQGYIFSGAVDLGALGSSVANTTLAGPVTGGAITIVGLTIFSGGSKFYSGDTVVGQSGVGASLYLSPNTTISNTSSILINRNSLLGEEYWASTDSQDRIRDTTPISLRGGGLYAILYSPNLNKQENLGPVTLQRGFSSISVSTQYTSDFMTFSATLLARQPGATFITYVADPAVIGSGTGAVKLLAPPALSNGIVGGWALGRAYDGNSSRYDMATYDSARGFLPLSSAGRPAQIDTGGSTDNVLAVAPQSPLTADRTINSLVTGTAMVTPIDLGGHTLNVLSGGIFSYTPIINGNLTAGGNTPNSELFFFPGQLYEAFTSNMTANIIDNPGGSVSLVLSGGGLAVRLSGVNTYTGSTVVNGSPVTFINSSSVPTGTNLFDNGGNVTFAPSIISAVNLGNVTLTDGGIFTSTASISASSWSVDSGTINAPIVGSTAVIKNGTGSLTVNSQTAAFTGTIVVNAGSVTVGQLGGGSAVVAANASLTLSAPTGGIVTLNGGILDAGTTTFTGTLNVTAPSSVLAISTGQLVNISSNGLLTISNSNLIGGISETGQPSTSGIIVPQATALGVASIAVGTLTISGSVKFFSNTPPVTSRLNALSITGSSNNWSGSLDLANSRLVIEDAPTHAATLATVQDQLNFGRAHSAGIYSSSLSANTVLAVIDNAALSTPFTTFGGLPVDANSILIGPELLGDANADGRVDLNDLNTVLNNLGTTTSAWTSGNFDGALTIDLNDLNDVLNNLGSTYPNNATVQYAESLVAAATPEPASLAILMCAAPFLFTKSRRTPAFAN